jgi:hypothetical protein
MRALQIPLLAAAQVVTLCCNTVVGYNSVLASSMQLLLAALSAFNDCEHKAASKLFSQLRARL